MLNHKSLNLIAIALLSMPFLTGCDTLSEVDAKRMLNDFRPDARREAVAAIVTQWSWGTQPPYPGYYKKFAQTDPDPTVRAMAIRALNICRDATSTKIFIAGLQDDNELIRLESAKALANIPDPESIGGLEDLLTGSRVIMAPDGRRNVVAESKDVRIAAADALQRYRKLDVARTLVGYLNEQDFGVAWQSRQSLIKLTGQDLQYDESAWLNYLVGPSKPFG
jgi:HEAT repeat protein